MSNFSIETLEVRSHLSATLKGSTLVIRATPQDDQFVVSRVGTQIVVDHNGKREGSFAARKVARLSIALGDGNDTLDSRGKLPRMMVDGGNGDDYIRTSSGNDAISGGAGNDRINAGPGNDVVDGGADSDWLDGGTGTNTVDYSSRTEGFNINLSLRGDGFGRSGAENDTLMNFTIAQGSQGNDVIRGSDTAINQLFGNGGNDTLAADNAGDELYGGAGDDTLRDILGSVLMDGGDGNDTADYSQSNHPGGVYASLEKGEGYGTNVRGEWDSIFDCENLIGTPNDDYLYGDDNANRIDGGAGPDHIYGRAGIDTLIGGAGNDYIDATDGVVDVVDGGDGSDYVAPDFVTFPFGRSPIDSLNGVEQVGDPLADPIG